MINQLYFARFKFSQVIFIFFATYFSMLPLLVMGSIQSR